MLCNLYHSDPLATCYDNEADETGSGDAAQSNSTGQLQDSPQDGRR